MVQRFRIYKCAALMGIRKLRVGKIEDENDMVLFPEYYRQMARDPLALEKCRSCKLLPLCAGGCAAKAYFKNGSYYTGECMMTEDYLKSWVMDYVKYYHNLDALNK